MQIIQSIAVCIAVFLALRVLYQQFFPKKDKKSCGSKGCGC